MSGLLIPEHHRADRSFTDYNELDLDSEATVADMSVAQLESAIAKRVGGKLMVTYPQRRWSITANVQAGFVQICCPSLSVDKGYVIHMHGKTLHDILSRAVIAGGEILERYGISRSKAFDTDTIEALERDHRDEAISPDSEPEKRIIIP